MSEEQKIEETPATEETTPLEETPVAAAEETTPDPPQTTTEQEQGGDEEEEELTVDLDALPKMKVSELKNILKVLDLPTSGIKTVLIDRIQEHFAQEDEQEQTDDQKDETEEDAELYLSLKNDKSEASKAEEKSGEEEEDKQGDKPELTDEEKAKARAVKFNVKSDEEKKEERAAKFGVPTEKSEEAKKEERAAKFGIQTSKSAEDKKKARAERFGVEGKGGDSTTTTTTTTAAKTDNAIKTPVPVDEEKLKKRAARFNMEDTPPAKTCKYDIQQVMKEKVASGETIVSLTSGSLTPDERRKMRALKFGA